MDKKKPLDPIIDHWKLNPDAEWLVIPNRGGTNLSRRHCQYPPELLDAIREAIVEHAAEGFYIQRRPDSER